MGGSKNRKMKSYKNNGEKTEVRGCPSSGFLPPHPPLLFLFEEHNPIKNSFSMPRNIESSSLCYVVVAVVWWISCVWLLRPHELYSPNRLLSQGKNTGVGFPGKNTGVGCHFLTPGNSFPARDQTHVFCIGRWILYR